MCGNHCFHLDYSFVPAWGTAPFIFSSIPYCPVLGINNLAQRKRAFEAFVGIKKTFKAWAHIYSDNQLYLSGKAGVLSHITLNIESEHKGRDILPILAL